MSPEISMKSFDFRERLEHVDWQRILEDPHRLTTSFNRLSLVVLGRYTKGWSITAHVLAKFIFKLYKKNGPGYCSAYLKNCSTALLNYLSRDVSPEPKIPVMYSPKCSLTRSGIPRFILQNHRKIISKGGPEAEVVVRLYLSWFGFYRTYLNKFKRPDLSPIWTKGTSQVVEGTEAFNNTPNLLPGCHPIEVDLIDWLQLEFPKFALAQVKGFPSEITFGFDWQPTWSGGPNTKLTPCQTSVSVFLPDLDHWRWYMAQEPPGIAKQELHEFLQLVIDVLYHKRTVNLPVDLHPTTGASFLDLVRQIGRRSKGTWGILGKKVEGGGKVRIFAMLDSVRQALLRPLHNWMMSSLRSIPNDGTYDQLRPLRSIRDLRAKHLYSFDLTSATDRFPIFLQTAVLMGFFGPRIALVWEKLLSLPFKVPFLKKAVEVVFQIGQPLGAYSSWPTFALTHHGFVQYCAKRAGVSKARWFRRYAILGDDVIIAHSEVAQIYKELMILLGVKISAHKTITSDNGSCEFAKRFLWKGVDVSPVSFKEIYTTRRSTTKALVKRIQTFREVHRKEPYRWFGAGHKILPTFQKPVRGRWKRFHLMLVSPAGPFPLPFYWWCSQYTSSPLGREISAIVHQELMEKWQFSFEPDGIHADTEEDIVEEMLVGRPWIRSWLSTSTSFLLNLMGEDPITAWFHRPTVPSTPARPRVDRTLRMGKIYWIYDRMVAVSKRPPLKRLGE